MKLIKFAGITEAIRFNKVVVDVKRIGVTNLEAFSSINVITGKCSLEVFQRLSTLQDIAISKMSVIV